MNHPRIPLAIAALSIVLLATPCPALAKDTPAAKPEADAVMRLAGKVVSRRVEVDGAKQTRHVIDVGRTRYILHAAAGKEAALKKLAGKHVELTRPQQDPPRRWLSPVVLDAAVNVRIQKPVTTRGVVQVVAEGTRKQRYTLVEDDRVWEVAASDGWKFKKHAGAQVEATAFIATNGTAHALSAVKKVVRKSDGDALSQARAMAGVWRGAMTVTTVPPGTPGVRTGRFDISFTSDAKLASVKGRLFSTYDIIGLEVKAFDAKRRTVELALLYTFGQGNFRIEMEGTFSKDWNALTGDWTSKFVGLGTFELKIKRGK